MTYHKTPYGTNRLWLKRTEMPKDQTKLTMLFTALDTFCIWGGADKNEEEIISWEFHVEIPQSVIEKALIRFGCEF